MLQARPNGTDDSGTHRSAACDEDPDSTTSSEDTPELYEYSPEMAFSFELPENETEVTFTLKPGVRNLSTRCTKIGSRTVFTGTCRKVPSDLCQACQSSCKTDDRPEHVKLERKSRSVARTKKSKLRVAISKTDQKEKTDVSSNLSKLVGNTCVKKITKPEAGNRKKEVSTTKQLTWADASPVRLKVKETQNLKIDVSQSKDEERISSSVQKLLLEDDPERLRVAEHLKVKGISKRRDKKIKIREDLSRWHEYTVGPRESEGDVAGQKSKKNGITRKEAESELGIELSEKPRTIQIPKKTKISGRFDEYSQSNILENNTQSYTETFRSPVLIAPSSGSSSLTLNTNKTLMKTDVSQRTVRLLTPQQTSSKQKMQLTPKTSLSEIPTRLTRDALMSVITNTVVLPGKNNRKNRKVNKVDVTESQSPMSLQFLIDNSKMERDSGKDVSTKVPVTPLSTGNQNNTAPINQVKKTIKLPKNMCMLNQTTNTVCCSEEYAHPSIDSSVQEITDLHEVQTERVKEIEQGNTAECSDHMYSLMHKLYLASEGLTSVVGNRNTADLSLIERRLIEQITCVDKYQQILESAKLIDEVLVALSKKGGDKNVTPVHVDLMRPEIVIRTVDFDMEFAGNGDSALDSENSRETELVVPKLDESDKIVRFSENLADDSLSSLRENVYQINSNMREAEEARVLNNRPSIHINLQVEMDKNKEVYNSNESLDLLVSRDCDESPHQDERQERVDIHSRAFDSRDSTPTVDSTVNRVEGNRSDKVNQRSEVDNDFESRMLKKSSTKTKSDHVIIEDMPMCQSLQRAYETHTVDLPLRLAKSAPNPNIQISTQDLRDEHRTSLRQLLKLKEMLDVMIDKASSSSIDVLIAKKTGVNDKVNKRKRFYKLVDITSKLELENLPQDLTSSKEFSHLATVYNDMCEKVIMLEGKVTSDDTSSNYSSAETIFHAKRSKGAKHLSRRDTPTSDRSSCSSRRIDSSNPSVIIDQHGGKIILSRPTRNKSYEGDVMIEERITPNFQKELRNDKAHHTNPPTEYFIIDNELPVQGNEIKFKKDRLHGSEVDSSYWSSKLGVEGCKTEKGNAPLTLADVQDIGSYHMNKLGNNNVIVSEGEISGETTSSASRHSRFYSNDNKMLNRNLKLTKTRDKTDVSSRVSHDFEAHDLRSSYSETYMCDSDDFDDHVEITYADYPKSVMFYTSSKRNETKELKLESVPRFGKTLVDCWSGGNEIVSTSTSRKSSSQRFQLSSENDLVEVPCKYRMEDTLAQIQQPKTKRKIQDTSDNNKQHQQQKQKQNQQQGQQRKQRHQQQQKQQQQKQQKQQKHAILENDGDSLRYRLIPDLTERRLLNDNKRECDIETALRKNPRSTKTVTKRYVMANDNVIEEVSTSNFLEKDMDARLSTRGERRVHHCGIDTHTFLRNEQQHLKNTAIFEDKQNYEVMLEHCQKRRSKVYMQDRRHEDNMDADDESEDYDESEDISRDLLIDERENAMNFNDNDDWNKKRKNVEIVQRGQKVPDEKMSISTHDISKFRTSNDEKKVSRDYFSRISRNDKYAVSGYDRREGRLPEEKVESDCDSETERESVYEEEDDEEENIINRMLSNFRRSENLRDMQRETQRDHITTDEQRKMVKEDEERKIIKSEGRSHKFEAEGDSAELLDSIYNERDQERDAYGKSSQNAEESESERNVYFTDNNVEDDEEVEGLQLKSVSASQRIETQEMYDEKETLRKKCLKMSIVTFPTIDFKHERKHTSDKSKKNQKSNEETEDNASFGSTDSEVHKINSSTEKMKVRKLESKSEDKNMYSKFNIQTILNSVSQINVLTNKTEILPKNGNNKMKMETVSNDREEGKQNQSEINELMKIKSENFCDDSITTLSSYIVETDSTSSSGDKVKECEKIRSGHSEIDRIESNMNADEVPQKCNTTNDVSINNEKIVVKSSEIKCGIPLLGAELNRLENSAVLSMEGYSEVEISSQELSVKEQVTEENPDHQEFQIVGSSEKERKESKQILLNEGVMNSKEPDQILDSNTDVSCKNNSTAVSVASNMELKVNDRKARTSLASIRRCHPRSTGRFRTGSQSAKVESKSIEKLSTTTRSQDPKLRARSNVSSTNSKILPRSRSNSIKVEVKEQDGLRTSRTVSHCTSSFKEKPKNPVLSRREIVKNPSNRQVVTSGKQKNSKTSLKNDGRIRSVTSSPSRKSVKKSTGNQNVSLVRSKSPPLTTDFLSVRSESIATDNNVLEENQLKYKHSGHKEKKRNVCEIQTNEKNEHFNENTSRTPRFNVTHSNRRDDTFEANSVEEPHNYLVTKQMEDDSRIKRKSSRATHKSEENANRKGLIGETKTITPKENKSIALKRMKSSMMWHNDKNTSRDDESDTAPTDGSCRRENDGSAYFITPKITTNPQNGENSLVQYMQWIATFSPQSISCNGSEATTLSIEGVCDEDKENNANKRISSIAHYINNGEGSQLVMNDFRTRFGGFHPDSGDVDCRNIDVTNQSIRGCCSAESDESVKRFMEDDLVRMNDEDEEEFASDSVSWFMKETLEARRRNASEERRSRRDGVKVDMNELKREIVKCLKGNAGDGSRLNGRRLLTRTSRSKSPLISEIKELLKEKLANLPLKSTREEMTMRGGLGESSDEIHKYRTGLCRSVDKRIVIPVGQVNVRRNSSTNDRVHDEEKPLLQSTKNNVELRQNSRKTVSNSFSTARSRDAEKNTTSRPSNISIRPTPSICNRRTEMNKTRTNITLSSLSKPPLKEKCTGKNVSQSQMKRDNQITHSNNYDDRSSKSTVQSDLVRVATKHSPEHDGKFHLNVRHVSPSAETGQLLDMIKHRTRQLVASIDLCDSDEDNHGNVQNFNQVSSDIYSHNKRESILKENTMSAVMSDRNGERRDKRVTFQLNKKSGEGIPARRVGVGQRATLQTARSKKVAILK